MVWEFVKEKWAVLKKQYKDSFQDRGGNIVGSAGS